MIWKIPPKIYGTCWIHFSPNIWLQWGWWVLCSAHTLYHRVSYNYQGETVVCTRNCLLIILIPNLYRPQVGIKLHKSHCTLPTFLLLLTWHIRRWWVWEEVFHKANVVLSGEIIWCVDSCFVTIIVCKNPRKTSWRVMVGQVKFFL